jgi:hypothetical protein
MLREASPAVEDGTPSVNGRARARRGLRLVAVAMNVVLFATGLYFQAHPHDRRDLWTAGGVAGIALVNTAALTFRRPPAGVRRVTRLWRIALFANTILMVVAAAIVFLSAQRGVGQAVLHGALLLVPPLVTLAALRRNPPG